MVEGYDNGTYDNIAIGWKAGTNTAGSNNIYIGSKTGNYYYQETTPKNWSNMIFVGPQVGNNIPNNAGNVILIGNFDTSTIASGETGIGVNGYLGLHLRQNRNLTIPAQYTYNGDGTGSAAASYNGGNLVPYNHVVNNGSRFNQSNGRFNMDISGYVLCSFNSLIGRPATTSHAYVEFQVDGVRKSVRTHTMYDIGGNYTALNNTAIVYCPANSYVTCNIWTVGGATVYGDYYGSGLTFRYLG